MKQAPFDKEGGANTILRNIGRFCIKLYGFTSQQFALFVTNCLFPHYLNALSVAGAYVQSIEMEM
jgi:hypothetical protein